MIRRGFLGRCLAVLSAALLPDTVRAGEGVSDGFSDEVVESDCFRGRLSGGRVVCIVHLHLDDGTDAGTYLGAVVKMADPGRLYRQVGEPEVSVDRHRTRLFYRAIYERIS